MNGVVDHGDGTGTYVASNGMAWHLRKMPSFVYREVLSWVAYLPDEYQLFIPQGVSDKGARMFVDIHERDAYYGPGWYCARPINETYTLVWIIEKYVAELERRRRDGNPEANLVRIERPA